MKAKAIIFASMLLAGCQGVNHHANEPEQYAQSLSSVSRSEAGQPSKDARATSARWLNDSSSDIAQKDLWGFISDDLKMKVPDNSRIREQKNKFLRNKSYLHDVTLRAEPYMYWIVEQIKQRKMPMELVLLPIVESAFNPHATSSANAAGLWQIVPQTGRNYGLKQNQWYDGRRDVAASTTAALDMMQRMNRMFGGDWLLTVAAFNSGEGRVMQAVKANKRKGLPTDFWSLSLPRETSIYVPKMLALSDLIKNNKRYGIKLPQSNDQRALAKVDVGQQIQLTQAAEMAGMSLTKIKAFNPGYKKNVTAPNGPHYIMVPKAHVEQFKDSLAEGEIAAIQPSAQLASTNTSSKAKVSGYKVRSGDTISAIAKRLNISQKELLSMNNLRNNSKLKAGQTLQVANNASTSIADNSSITYKVRKGDSLASIAKRHGVNINDVMRWNSVITKASQIQPGDMLTLYVRDSANSNS
ncbi:murein transglycosylase D [Hafnia alvei]|jgi:membrane-bound lytic murein transglycosylase D|uniref:murein transglycosylase D n=1 Tax=Hafnia alvei TaxID=569 RepID=UPI000DFC608D|nr:murein transglycosylase D [Hafnia alvei]MDU3156842.1 murein transglycosylase D [Hafnia alvei]TBL46110.1 murein transglycosylase D [Hafnia alvei]TBM08311.1 murein transglycosylase D [Hafnia alvei]STR05635.1 Membrane-bound lytic murein transglycosylase D precursor [Hafnia alvei]